GTGGNGKASGRKDWIGQKTGVSEELAFERQGFGIGQPGRKIRRAISGKYPRAIGREPGDSRAYYGISCQRANLLSIGAIPDARESFGPAGNHIAPVRRERDPRRRAGRVPKKRAQGRTVLTVLHPQDVV